MSYGVVDLSVLQFGKEGTSGTQVAASRVWSGKSKDAFQDDTTVVKVETQVGILGGVNRSYIEKEGTTLSIPETEATFEQTPYFFLAGLGMNNTGVADGTASSGYKYTWTVPTTALPSLTTLTAEFGDNAFQEYTTYCYTREIKITGVAGKAWMCSGVLGARANKPLSALSVGASLPAVEEIMFGRGRLWLDAVTSAFGTTQVQNQFMGFELNIKVMYAEKPTADGRVDLDFNHIVLTGVEITGKVTFERSTQVNPTNGEIYHMKNQTPRLMRIEAFGSAYTTPGSATLFSGKKGVRIDLPIKWDERNTPEDQDGNRLQTLAFESLYDTTVATRGSLVFANEDATLFP